MPTKQDTGKPEDADTAAKAGRSVSDDIADLQAKGFGAMSGVGLAWVEALSDMGSEVLSFVAERIREDVKTQHRMLHCKDIAQLQHIQAEFVQTAIDQYREETGRLVEMGQKAFAAPLSGGVDKG